MPPTTSVLNSPPLKQSDPNPSYYHWCVMLYVPNNHCAHYHYCDRIRLTTQSLSAARRSCQNLVAALYEVPHHPQNQTAHSFALYTIPLNLVGVAKLPSSPYHPSAPSFTFSVVPLDPLGLGKLPSYPQQPTTPTIAPFAILRRAVICCRY